MPFPEYVSDTQYQASNYLLTSIEEIHRLFSMYGEKLHTDDLDPSDTNYNEENSSEVNRANYLTELVQRATSHVMSRLAPRYTIENVYRIPRLREIATYWACHKLTKRRGNEPVYEEEYLEAMEELDQMRMGEIFLDAPSNGPRAYIQSVVTDNRYSRTQTRVIPEASSRVIPGQRVTFYHGFAWL